MTIQSEEQLSAEHASDRALVAANNDKTRQLRFWLIGIMLFCGLIVLFHAMLMPFVVAMVIGYLLNPVADAMERKGAPRWLAATLVLLFFLLLLVAALLVLVPLIHRQISELIAAMPHYSELARQRGWPLVEGWIHQLNALGILSGSPESLLGKARDAAGQYSGQALHWLGALISGIVTSGFAIFDIISLLIVTPVVAFYFLRDWHPLCARINHDLPRRHAAVIREELREIDTTLSGFVRGQATVCLCLALYYSIALSFAGLSFGLVIGLCIGILSFIPFVGSLLGFAISVGIALFQFDTYTGVFIVMGIFAVGQLTEANVLTPKLVGDRVGLHPVWVMFALLAGGSLLGFSGVLIAVPVAAVIGVLVRYAHRQYLQSRFYTGVPELAAKPRRRRANA